MSEDRWRRRWASLTLIKPPKKLCGSGTIALGSKVASYSIQRSDAGRLTLAIGKTKLKMNGMCTFYGRQSTRRVKSCFERTNSDEGCACRLQLHSTCAENVHEHVCGLADGRPGYVWALLRIGDVRPLS